MVVEKGEMRLGMILELHSGNAGADLAQELVPSLAQSLDLALLVLELDLGLTVVLWETRGERSRGKGM